MTEKSEYAVLQYVEQGQYCQVIHTSVQGHSVMEYAKRNQKLKKEEIAKLIISLKLQLEKYYKCEEQEAYGFVNPYALIVVENSEVRLLDMEAEVNREWMFKMQKKKVRQLFVNPEYVLSQRKRREDDFYGFGKMVQFLFETCCEEKKRRLREQFILRKIYTICERGKKGNREEWNILDKYLQKLKGKVEEKKEWRHGICLGIGMMMVCAAMGNTFFHANRDRAQMRSRIQQLEAELGTFEKESEIELQYVEFLELLQYPVLDEGKSARLESDLKVLLTNNQKKMESLSGKLMVAMAYEKMERYEAALVEYEELKSVFTESEEQKMIYLKLLELYKQMDMMDMLQITYEEAMETLPECIEDERFDAFNNTQKT